MLVAVFRLRYRALVCVLARAFNGKLDWDFDYFDFLAYALAGCKIILLGYTNMYLYVA